MAPVLNFDPTTEIPSLTGKVILVTGGTAGLGRETILGFAAHAPSHLMFSGRSQASADSLIEEVRSKYPNISVTFIRLDLSSLASVREGAKQVLSKTDRLDILMANAGIMAVPPAVTEDGYEIQFGTNHMGHSLLTKLLLPTLEATAKAHGDARIVLNTSQGYQFASTGGILFDKVKTDQCGISWALGGWYRYGQSKIANMLYARALAEHHPSVTTVVIHPGISMTGIVTGLGWMSRWFVYLTTVGNTIEPEQCAWNQQWAATAPLGKGEKQVESGKYYEPVGVKTTPTGEGDNAELAERLWKWTAEELKGWEL